MFCHNCGSKLSNNAEFCANCGVAVKKSGTKNKHLGKSEGLVENSISFLFLKSNILCFSGPS